MARGNPVLDVTARRPSIISARIVMPPRFDVNPYAGNGVQSATQRRSGTSSGGIAPTLNWPRSVIS
jgi:hypothetical protein